MDSVLQRPRRNCSDLRGSADYSAYCGGATKHGISTANRFRSLKREQLRPGRYRLNFRVIDSPTSNGMLLV